MEIRSQKLAKNAYGLVESVAILDDNDKEFKKKYRTLALNFPTMILQAGLSQSVGFLLAKGKETKEENSNQSDNKKSEHQELLKHLETLLRDDYSDKSKTSETFHKKVLDANISEYQLLTRKALDASSMLKRYTQALLSDIDKEQKE